MITLAIETSCDETGVALLRSQDLAHHELLVNLVSSQIAIHKKFGGVVPILAARAHEKNLPFLVKKALKSASRLRLTITDIAYTAYPGLEPALVIGKTFAKTLGFALRIPAFPIDHLKGHLLSPLLSLNPLPDSEDLFPAIGLIISGGHTQLYLMSSLRETTLLGETRDDAIGEAFDKVARLLGLNYPGGPKIEALAKKGGKDAIAFPSPMIHSNNYHFSFSGLKTSVLYFLQKQEKPFSSGLKANVARAFQDAAFRVIVKKTARALCEIPARALFIGGGVASNNALKQLLWDMLQKEFPFARLLAPEKQFATDNAAMIALVHNLMAFSKT